VPIDYDALAAQHGGTPVPRSSTGAVDYDALAAQHGGTPIKADFQTTAIVPRNLFGEMTATDLPPDVAAQFTQTMAGPPSGRTAPEDMGVGAAKGWGATYAHLGQFMLDFPVLGRVLQAVNTATTGMTPDQQRAAFTQIERELAPANSAQRVGYGAEKIAETIAPANALGVAGTAVADVVAPRLAPMVGQTLARVIPKAAVEGAGWAGITKAQGGNPVVGGVLGAAGPAVVEPVVGAVGAGLRALAPRLTPAAAASNALAAAEGVPLDTALLTDNPVIASAQKAVGTTLGGSLPAKAAQMQRDAALTALGRKLAGEVSPGPMTPETAGAAARARLTTAAAAQDAALGAEGAQLAAEVHPQAMTPELAGVGAQGRLQGAMRTFGDEATRQYDALRAIEADPAHVERVLTAPPGSPAFRSILGKLTTGVESAASDANPEIQAWAQRVGGRGPTGPELTAMRQIEAELEAQPYTPYLLRPTRYGGGLEPVEGTGGAGAPVYDDILQAAPGTASMTRGEVQGAIAKTLETGEWNNASRGALSVAQDRLRSSGALTGPQLPAGAPLLGTTTKVGLPVNLATEKQMLEPLYTRLTREAQLVPLQGDKARALVALDRLMRGPDVESVSVVDAALGDLKALARSDIPELRTAGQGAAAAAVQRVSAAVDRAVAKAGPAAGEALAAGRRATVAKYGAGELYKGLEGEPVGAFRTLTAPQDARVAFLREVSDYVPESMPEVGRGLLDQWADLTPAARLKAWDGLGAGTKARLFGGADQVQRLEAFFTRATANPASAVLADLHVEPVKLVKQLTQPGDASIALLRRVQQQAPDSLPEIGRAKLEDWLATATQSPGKFQHGDKLFADWQALGSETKRALFGGPDQIKRLDEFFELIKRSAYNPNPSGSGPQAWMTAQLLALVPYPHPMVAAGAAGLQGVAYGLSKLLTSPQGAALINRALRLSEQTPTGAQTAAARAAWRAVQAAGARANAPATPAAAGPAGG
jgi:hypothetical protein